MGPGLKKPKLQTLTRKPTAWNRHAQYLSQTAQGSEEQRGSQEEAVEDKEHAQYTARKGNYPGADPAQAAILCAKSS